MDTKQTGQKLYQSKKIAVKDNWAVSFLYQSLPGRLLLKLLVRPVFSKALGLLLDTRFSRLFISSFVRNNQIDLAEYEEVRYRSFNAFFTRQIRQELRPFPVDEQILAAPCDGKLTAYQITKGSTFSIKNSVYDLAGLLQDASLAADFAGGWCLIFRLAPDDYHRYAFIDSGNVTRHKKIKGVLHTVRPISQERYQIYTENAREYMVLQTKNFAQVIQMEVGALFVGRITNYPLQGSFQRGAEKGMFEFGGSTIVLLLQKDTVALEQILIENTRRAEETINRLGCRLGEKIICQEEASAPPLA